MNIKFKTRKYVGIIAISLLSATNAATASVYTEYKQDINNFEKGVENQDKSLWNHGQNQIKSDWLSQNMLKVSDIASNAKKVPAPAAILLFGPALLGLMGITGLNRKPIK